jgi:hypothetical protein
MKKKIPEIFPVKYKTARSLVLEYFRVDYPDLTDKQLLDQDTEFTVFLDEEWEEGATVAELLSEVRRIGVWGFCVHSKASNYKEIHYWLGKSANAAQVLELFSHETAHAIGIKSEAGAKKYAGVAIFAYLMMKDHLKWKKW